MHCLQAVTLQPLNLLCEDEGSILSHNCCRRCPNTQNISRTRLLGNQDMARRKSILLGYACPRGELTTLFSRCIRRLAGHDP